MDNSIKNKIQNYEQIKQQLLDAIIYDMEEDKKRERIISSIAAFQATNYSGTNIELSEITGISKSSIQRYLSDKKLIEQLTDTETYELIRDSIEKNKQAAKKKGGINSTKNSVVFKDKKGRFRTRKSYIKNQEDSFISINLYDDKIDRQEKKKLDIVFLVDYYLTEDTSLEQMSIKTGLTKDYIYDCLTSNIINEIINQDMVLQLRKKLDSNYPSNMIKKGNEFADDDKVLDLSRKLSSKSPSSMVKKRKER